MDVFYSSPPARGILIHRSERHIIDSGFRQYLAPHGFRAHCPAPPPLPVSILRMPGVLPVWITLPCTNACSSKQRPMGACWQCRVSGSTPALLVRIFVLTRSAGGSRAREYCWWPGSRGLLGSPTVGQAVAECRSFGTGRETNSGVLPDDKSWGGKCRERFVYILYWGRSIDSDGAGGA